MSITMPDLTFFDSDKYLWNKEILEKVDGCILAIKDNGGAEATEDCLQEFFLDFASAKNHFINDMRNLSLIMKCRTKADNDSNFGGRQCAKFMQELKSSCDRYLNASIYSDNTKQTSPAYIIKKMRDMAARSERKAWDFEDQTKQLYLNTGKDNTLEIFNKSGYNI